MFILRLYTHTHFKNLVAELRVTSENTVMYNMNAEKLSFFVV